MGLLSGRRRRDAVVEPARAGAAKVLSESGLFDAEWYLATYTDIAEAGLEPLGHYLGSGAFEGRQPNPVFDSAWYLASNADVRASGVNPLLHYAVSGAAEGRAAGPLFDTAYYLAENPEVERAGLNPLVHFLRHGRAEGRAATPYDDAEAFEAATRLRRRGASGGSAALFRGLRGDHVHFALTPREPDTPEGGLPLPPLRLAQRNGSATLDDFDASGAALRDAIVRALPEGFTWKGSRCLDFGSGVGHVLRHFRDEADLAEIWGCDSDGSGIRWSVQNLSPPFRFFQIGEVPTLPFEDDSFDLVYAVSDLSHLQAAWHEWLMEIRRILKPGGAVLASFLGQAPMEEMLGEPYWTRGEDFGLYVKGPHLSRSEGGPAAFVSPGWIKAFWGSLFDIDYIAMDGLLDYQSFCVMRKPLRGAPIRTDIPVLQLSTTQAFNPDAVGRIHPQFDTRLHYRKSYGLHVRAGRAVRVDGWIAFRGDEPDGLDVTVDGRRVAAEAEFEPGEPHGGWAASVRTSFSFKADLSGVTPGAHRLQVSLRSRNGLGHTLTIPLLIR